MKLPLYGTALFLLTAVSVHGANVQVFLLAGQSNMVGRGNRRELSTELLVPQEDVLFYLGSSWQTLRPGGGRDFGPEISFGRTLADTFPSESFALIKHAEGGTSLEHDWDPGTGTAYQAFRATVAEGLLALTSAGHSPQITGMLWTQGERDVVIGTTASYQANLTELIADVRRRYRPNLPFFVSQLSTSQTNLVDRASRTALEEIRQAQAEIAAGDPHTHLIITDTFSLASDNLHFDAAGQIALGQAFAASYVRTVPEPATLAMLACCVPLMVAARGMRRRASEASLRPAI